MAIISAGYDGTVDEVQFAGLVPKAGASEYGVDLAADYAVTAVAGQDRTVSIAPGAAWGHSVIDVMDLNETRALAAPVSGSRWDMIVLRRDWQPPGGASTIEVIQGGQTSVTLPARTVGKGVKDDQPLALVRVDAGSSTIGQIIDLRCWGRNGGVTAKDPLVLQYLGAIGAEVKIGREVYSLVMGETSASWQKSQEKYAIGSGATTFSYPRTENQVSLRVSFPPGLFSSAYSSRPNLQLTMTNKSGPGRLFVQAQDVSTTGFTLYCYKSDLGESIPQNLTVTVDWLAMQ